MDVENSQLVLYLSFHSFLLLKFVKDARCHQKKNSGYTNEDDAANFLFINAFSFDRQFSINMKTKGK